jgi:hypothetical protein
MENENAITLYLPPEDNASGRMDLQVNGETALEWHDRTLRRECEASPRAKSEILSVIWEWWKIERSQFHYREAGEVDLGSID